MKNKKNNKLYILLGKGFLAFSVALFLVIVIIRICLISYLEKKYAWGDLETLFLNVETFSDHDFKRINIEKYAGENGHILVVDENYDLVYADDQDFVNEPWFKSLIWVPEYHISQWYEKAEFVTREKEKRYLIQKKGYTRQGIQVLEYSLLNENYQVISGDLFAKGTQLDNYAISHLAGETANGAEIYRKDYRNPENENRSLFVITKQIILEDYYEAINLEENSQWLLVIQYFFLVSIFIYFLTRKIRKYIEPLHRGISEYVVEESEVWEMEYKGPVEFREIAESFSHLTKELKKNKLEKRQLEENKSQLLADISHDLKTPLTVIQGYLNLIKENGISEAEKQKYLQIAYNKTCQMEELIHTFHEYSLLEHPDLPVSLKKENICRFLEIYLAEKYEEIEFAGFELEAEIPQKAIYCNIDGNLFKRALDNIINNSLRYNPSGTLVLVQIEEKGQWGEISLGDNGIGIELKDTQKLFEAFGSKVSKMDVAQGSGLGLSITKKIITAHKGKIRLNQTPKIGWKTEFIIQIPCSK